MRFPTKCLGLGPQKNGKATLGAKHKAPLPGLFPIRRIAQSANMMSSCASSRAWECLNKATGLRPAIWLTKLMAWGFRKRLADGPPRRHPAQSSPTHPGSTRLALESSDWGRGVQGWTPQMSSGGVLPLLQSQDCQG